MNKGGEKTELTISIKPILSLFKMTHSIKRISDSRIVRVGKSEVCRLGESLFYYIITSFFDTTGMKRETDSLQARRKK